MVQKLKNVSLFSSIALVLVVLGLVFVGLGQPSNGVTFIGIGTVFMTIALISLWGAIEQLLLER